MVIDETLRKYPPAWVGPRRTVRDIDFEGTPIPERAFVNYCSWASHHLPDVFADPEEFRPERFTPEARAALPKGAYVPFGGGSRTCIGMRFGQLEVRTIATMLLAARSLEVPADFRLTIRQMPTISPKQGLPVHVGAPVASGSPPLRAVA
jgi:cytochrome P450